MRKNAAEKTAKAIDTAKPAASATAAKAKKAGGTGRVVKSAQQTEPPRISLATLAAMDTTPKADKVRKSVRPAKPGKATEVAKVPEPAKLAKAPKLVKVAKVAKATEITKVASVTDVMDAATDSGTANGRRALRGIKLAWNLDAAATDASKALSAPLVQEARKVPTPAAAPVNIPPPQPKPTLKVRPATPRIAPKSVPQPSFLASVWAYFRNPSGVTLAGLAGLAVALAFFAATQDGITSDNSAAPLAVQPTAMAGPNDASALFNPWDYPPTAHPPYPGPDYGGHSNYREGRLRY
jgi:hypothetical protein